MKIQKALDIYKDANNNARHQSKAKNYYLLYTGDLHLGICASLDLVCEVQMTSALPSQLWLNTECPRHLAAFG